MIGKAAILGLFGIMAAPHGRNDRVHAARNALSVALAEHRLGLRAAAVTTHELKSDLDVEAQDTELRQGHDRLRETMREMLGRMDR